MQNKNTKPKKSATKQRKLSLKVTNLEARENLVVLPGCSTTTGPRHDAPGPSVAWY